MFDARINRELKDLEEKIDFRTGKVKRMLSQGFLSKPAWARASFWFVLGGLVFAMVQSY